jgi:transposase-like protein
MTLTTFKRLFQEYQESGLNIKDFCANQCLAPSTFYYWRNKLEETSQNRPENFVPLVFDPNQQALDNQTNQPSMKGVHTSGNNAPIEFVFPNGTKMVLRDNVDMRLLKAIVHLFD